MSYALRADRQGCRAVNGPEDLLPGETYCVELPVIEPLPPTREEIEALRLVAYADPLTGSDRYFSEANREALLGNSDAAEQAKQRGLERFVEIQVEHPWPAEPEPEPEAA